MAGTCVALGGALPASWWQAPSRLDVFTDRSNVTQTTHILVLQPGTHANVGRSGYDIGPAGGTIDYGWLLQSFAVPFGPTPLRVLVAPVPEPATLALVATALVSVAGMARSKRALL
jgi:hypothetical protein